MHYTWAQAPAGGAGLVKRVWINNTPGPKSRRPNKQNKGKIDLMHVWSSTEDLMALIESQDQVTQGIMAIILRSKGLGSETMVGTPVHKPLEAMIKWLRQLHVALHDYIRNTQNDGDPTDLLI